MSLTVGQAIEQVRRDLGDIDTTNAKWTTDQLQRHIQHAVQEMSRHIPRTVKTATTTSASRDLSLSSFADRIQIAAVEYPTGNWPPTYVRFSEWGDTLTMHSDNIPAASEAVNIYWLAMHTMTPEGTTIPQNAEQLVAIGAAGYAAQEWQATAVNAVNTGGQQTIDFYRQLARDKLAEFDRALKQIGERGKLHTSKLYAPADPAPSQSTDWGP